MFAKRVGLVALVPLLFLTIDVAVDAYNYCTDSPCRTDHIGCNPLAALSADCPPGATVVAMNKTLVLERINNFRVKYAGGDNYSSAQFPPAIQMAEMQWSDELAQLALYNIRRCKNDHDICRTTEHFSYAGQSVGRYIEILDGWEENVTNDEMILRRLQVWERGFIHVTFAELRTYPFFTRYSYGDALLMLTDRNTHVGCAALSFQRSGFQIFDLTCNYATTLLMMQPTFKYGGLAGSKCTMRSQRYENLCALGETYDLTGFPFPFRPYFNKTL